LVAIQELLNTQGSEWQKGELGAIPAINEGSFENEPGMHGALRN